MCVYNSLTALHNDFRNKLGEVYYRMTLCIGVNKVFFFTVCLLITHLMMGW